MFNELSVESYRIPWLIWIQLIVLFLLFTLFYCFTISDDDDASVVPETSSVAAKSFRYEEIQRIEKRLLTANNDSNTPVSTNGQHLDITLKGGQNLSIKDEIETCSSITSEELLEEEESSTLSSHHPCNFFQVATFVFLKCFGLDDSTSGSSSKQKHRKRKES
ncbi:uncharacterized protein LOC131661167 isoform X2 [Vicia villosa]|uniref:uncharacterized protein LOC131661167 isoform X2 n=1 Tax=Vicia villosa TaxID=3911 RepID=UPI00273C98AF|nr:uncharacterized protein LOC131661167 isoform X2 [Vicia villosa]